MRCVAMHAGDTPSGSVRLVTSSGSAGALGYAAGRVQVLVNESAVWRAICDDQWGIADARVVCRMLCFQCVH